MVCGTGHVPLSDIIQEFYFLNILSLQKLGILATSMVFCLFFLECVRFMIFFSTTCHRFIAKHKFSLNSANPSTSRFLLHAVTEFWMVSYYSVLSFWAGKLTSLKDLQTCSRLQLSVSVSPWKQNHNAFSHFTCDAKNSQQKSHNVFQCTESVFVCLFRFFYNLGRLKWEQIQRTITAATQLSYCIYQQFYFIFQLNHCSVLTKLKQPFLTKKAKSAFFPLNRQ